jgi:lysozyme
MTSPNLAVDLRIYEGLRLTAYPDPLSGGAPWTIGYGHTGREVHPGLVWTGLQAEDALTGDIAAVCRGLDASLPWWRMLDDTRQDCLANMAFNMGVHGLLGFAGFLALVKARNFPAAAADVLNTRWAAQVGVRARRIAEQMRTGLHQGAA